MEDFKSRFGLGWKSAAQSTRTYIRDLKSLASDDEVTEQVRMPRGMEDALTFYGRPFLEVLKAAPDKRARLFDVAREIKARLDVVIPVEQYLVSQGYVTRLDQDTLGNDTVQLT